MSNWLDTKANRMKQTYVNGFLDVSGNLTLRSGSATIFNNITSGNLTTGNAYITDNILS